MTLSEHEAPRVEIRRDLEKMTAALCLGVYAKNGLRRRDVGSLSTRDEGAGTSRHSGTVGKRESSDYLGPFKLPESGCSTLRTGVSENGPPVVFAISTGLITQPIGTRVSFKSTTPPPPLLLRLKPAPGPREPGTGVKH